MDSQGRDDNRDRMLKVRGDRRQSSRIKPERKIVMILDKGREVVSKIFGTCLDEDLGSVLTKETLEKHKTEIRRQKKSKYLFVFVSIRVNL